MPPQSHMMLTEIRARQATRPQDPLYGLVNTPRLENTDGAAGTAMVNESTIFQSMQHDTVRHMLPVPTVL